ncbi:MAG: FHA domain-containing protein [Gemmatimonadales bacterium]|nr:MAG: FHA domain-containing protein [Gemmatimonadales bacterium]
MMELEYNGRHHPILPGEMLIGSDPESALRLSGEGVLWRHAMVQGMPDGSIAIRQATPDAEVVVNGVLLGENPSPLLHGDKIRLGDLELHVVDSVRAGHTEFMSAAGLPDPAAARAPAPEWTAEGGRLVCLTDGREYPIEDSVVLGREASADVVVTGQDVSRKHAEIVYRGDQYVLTDHSTNGTFVNGLRIGADRTLARSDVIRIGTEEFRFYATMSPAARPAALEEVMADQPQSDAPLGASQKLFDTLHGIPFSSIQEEIDSEPDDLDDSAPAGPEPGLGSLLVREGPRRGERLPIRASVIHLGRGDHNDVVLDDSSVSASHAKLQCREGIWFLSDMGSTNGTLVEGEEVATEMAVAPGATIRLGEMALLFDPADVEVPHLESGGTRVVRAAEVEEPEEAESTEPEAVAGWQATSHAPEPFEVSHTLIDEEFGGLPPVRAAEPAPDAVASPEPPVEEFVPVPGDEAPAAQASQPSPRPMPVFVTASAKPSRSWGGLMTVAVVVVLAVVAYFLGLLDKLLELFR